MTIAWFTPFHARSAIGEFSQHITAELAKLADVELWISGDADVEPWTSDDAPMLSTGLPVVYYSPESSDLEKLRDHDIIVYNLGNYLGYHGDVHAVSKEYPGIVILHDRVLHHLFSDMWLMGSEPDPPRYIERMGAYYGADGAEVARACLEGERKPVWESDEEVLLYPLYEESIVNALGVITHSSGQARDVGAQWLGPVTSLQLPCYTDVLAKVDDTPRSPEDERLRLLTIGHLNPNKQVHRVIEMLLANPEIAARVEYRVIGPDGGFTAYSSHLGDLVAQGDASLKVEIVGWLPDEELEREMARTDVFVNLRHPNIEGGSASLMKQLAYGRPVLCFDSGYFGEMPQGTVMRVPTGDFGAAAGALRELVSSAELRRELGERAHALAVSYNERSYAEGLLAFVDESRGAVPALRFLDSVAYELGEMRVDSRLSIFDKIANDFGRILAL